MKEHNRQKETVPIVMVLGALSFAALLIYDPIGVLDGLKCEPGYCQKPTQVSTPDSIREGSFDNTFNPPIQLTTPEK